MYAITFTYRRRPGQRAPRYLNETETVEVEAASKEEAINQAFDLRESRAFGRHCTIEAETC